MKRFTKLLLSLFAAAFISSTPLIAAELPNIGAARDAGKPDIGAAIKDKAAGAVEQARDKADSKAEKIKDSLGQKKENAADQAGKEIMDVKEESVTVQTPQGEAQATEITVTPEGATPAPGK